MYASASAQSGASPGSSATSSTNRPAASALASAAPRLGGLLARERVLQLVLGQLRRVLALAVVAFGRQVEVRVAVRAVGEPLVDDLPAHRLPVLDRAQRVADPGSVGAVASERAELLAPVGVP